MRTFIRPPVFSLGSNGSGTKNSIGVLRPKMKRRPTNRGAGGEESIPVFHRSDARRRNATWLSGGPGAPGARTWPEIRGGDVTEWDAKIRFSPDREHIKKTPYMGGR